MSRRRIAVFTGNRAEYGLQVPILRAVRAHPGLELALVVSGAHLDPAFGETVHEIEADGFPVAARVEIEPHGDTADATARAIGAGVVATCDALAALAPDLAVVYADRFEGFAALIAATQTNLPTAHIEGGDRTEGGALDDSVRHAMTKLAHLHFTTNASAAERVRSMGEEPWRVHDVGFPTVDLIAAGEFTPPAEVARRYALDLSRPVIVFTQHSVTTEFERAQEQVRPSLAALRTLAGRGVQVIATYPNNDAGGRVIAAALDELAAEHVPGIQVRDSLGRRDYHGILQLIATVTGGACVGNSSSGIKETPAFGCPTVDVGSRQEGRLRGGNVLDCGYDQKQIVAAVTRALEDEPFLERCRSTENPYGTGGAGRKIAEVLARVPLDARLLRKRMTLG